MTEVIYSLYIKSHELNQEEQEPFEDLFSKYSNCIKEFSDITYNYQAYQMAVDLFAQDQNLITLFQRALFIVSDRDICFKVQNIHSFNQEPEVQLSYLTRFANRDGLNRYQKYMNH